MTKQTKEAIWAFSESINNEKILWIWKFFGWSIWLENISLMIFGNSPSFMQFENQIRHKKDSCTRSIQGRGPGWILKK